VTAAPRESRPTSRSRAARVKAWFRSHRRELSTYAISALFHAALGLLLWSIVINADRSQPIDTMIQVSEHPVENLPELQAIEQPEPIRPDALQANPQETTSREISELIAPINVRLDDLEPAVRSDVDDPVGPPILRADHFGGRASATTRQALVEQYGGNAASEQAVQWGLEWLARHQDDDGSWSFDHISSDSMCEHDCTMPGSLTNCRMGATALALLCFLGAGHTPASGQFRSEVDRGLEYLIEHMEVTPNGGDLRGGFIEQGMYVQGLATIALCEAHAMTAEVLRDEESRELFNEDPALLQRRQEQTLRIREAAQEAIGFIAWAQAEDGGWRYLPQQRGDTSVVGWQVMALESARSARIRVPPGTLAGVNRFLNRVQIERGARYGYAGRSEGGATTAVGLLCRMYLGWGRGNNALGRGVQHLSRRAPSPTDMYYNYYATQVLHHWGGEEWRRWNAVMRDQLIDAQETRGHARGSWLPTSQHGDTQGGRLYQTTLSIMTLEVYYRHLPLYRDRDLGDEDAPRGLDEDNE
jgi:hypothetical protein